MKFSDWIDEVNAEVRQRAHSVTTAELSWDSAMWRDGATTVVASLDDDGTTASVFFDRDPKLSVSFRETSPASVARTVADRFDRRG